MKDKILKLLCQTKSHESYFGKTVKQREKFEYQNKTKKNNSRIKT